MTEPDKRLGKKVQWACSIVSTSQVDAEGKPHYADGRKRTYTYNVMNRLYQ